jgi:PPOX class probable F420-dependent enzyme
VVPDASGLAFWTPAGTGKLKRIRNNGRVTVQPCDVRGNPRGEVVEGQARIGDQADRLRVGKGLQKKYGILGRLTLLGSRLRRGTHGTVVVLVS